MDRHSLDPISAVLAVIATGLGLLVAIDRVGPLDRNTGWWIALAALVFGLAIIPWGQRDRIHRADAPAGDEVDADVGDVGVR